VFNFKGRSTGLTRGGYLIAAVAVSVTLLIRVMLIPVIGPYRTPYLPFVCAIALVAQRYGAGPARFATVLSAASAWLVFLPPALHPLKLYWKTDLLSLAVFLATGMVLSSTAHRLAQAIREAVAARERELQYRELATARYRLKVLEGMLPTCAHCHSIRDASGTWHRLEQYISDHSEARFSHGLCPSCIPLYYPDDIADEVRKPA
jgi:K+-sensing histidine kinase KdpD